MKIRRTLPLLCTTGFLLLGSGAASGQACPPGDPCPPASPPYSFFRYEDEVALAMRTVWLSQFEVHADFEQAQAALQARSDAETLLRARSGHAARYLVETLQTLSGSDDGGWISLGRLLHLLGGDDAVLARLFEVASAPPPALPAGSPGAEQAIPPHQFVRARVVAEIADAAGRGSELARESLLGLLSAPDPSVRAGAVRGLYRVSRDRAQVQREMRRSLDVDEHHLLYGF